jgi:hypothetical protein
MLARIRKKHTLVLSAFGIVGTVIGLKLGAHWLGWEVLDVTPLFSGIVAANVFLMGFLLSGVLSDFKESERLPGELATTLAAFTDEALCVHQRSKSPVGLELLVFVAGLSGSINAWFFKRERTRELMEKVTDLNRFFLALEPLTQANYIVRLKQEQQNLRRILTRIHTIRETSFISSGYLIAELTSTFLALGLVFADIDPFYESLFVVGVIVFLLAYLILLIRDLDNPFGYYEAVTTEDVSLKPLEDFRAGLDLRLRELGLAPQGGRTVRP